MVFNNISVIWVFNLSYLQLKRRFMVFNNISVISWQLSFIGGGNWSAVENHQPVTSHWQTLSPIIVSSTPCHEQGSNSQLLWW
jgi:hypothetical protein